MKRPGTFTSVRDAEGSRLRRGDSVRLTYGNAWFRHYLRTVLDATGGAVLFLVQGTILPIPARFVHKVH